MLGRTGFSAIIIVFILIGLSSPAYGSTSPPRYFISVDTLDTVSGNHIDGPFTLNVQIKSGDKILKTDTVNSSFSPRKIFVDWYSTEYPQDSKVFLWVSKEGYRDSEQFAHDLYFEAPEGTVEVFAVEFELEKTAGEPEWFDEIFSINEENRTFEILVESEYELEDAGISFNKDTKELKITFLPSDHEGKVRVTLPVELLGGPYAITVDGVNVFESDKVYEESDTVITVPVDVGNWEIAVQGSTAIPEFPQTSLAAIVGITAVIVVSVLLARSRSFLFKNKM